VPLPLSPLLESVNLAARFSVLSVRYHIEVFVAHAVQSFPTQLWPTLLAHVANYAHKPQVE
jgi:hypothetical protein